MIILYRFMDSVVFSRECLVNGRFSKLDETQNL
jgi:hypothetical protein